MKPIIFNDANPAIPSKTAVNYRKQEKGVNNFKTNSGAFVPNIYNSIVAHYSETNFKSNIIFYCLITNHQVFGREYMLLIFLVFVVCLCSVSCVP